MLTCVYMPKCVQFKWNVKFVGKQCLHVLFVFVFVCFEPILILGLPRCVLNGSERLRGSIVF